MEIKRLLLPLPLLADMFRIQAYQCDLETMVILMMNGYRTRTGVEERRILKEKDWAASDMAVPAVKELCKKRGIDPPGN